MDVKNKQCKAVTALLHDLDAYFYGKNFWQAGLYELVSPLTAEQALWKPSANRHCIWEVVKHINFWKTYAVAYVTDKEKPDRRNNWIKIDKDLTARDWKSQLAELKRVHEDIKKPLAKWVKQCLTNGIENPAISGR